jgi:purine-binding chemotaxis protein CheW
VTFIIEKGQYAVSSQFVSTMVAVPGTRPVPHAPPYVRGIINLRGRVLPLIDLRLRMGYSSALKEQDDFRRLLAQREQDHVSWLNELEASVEEGRDFTLTTDPTRCAFGQWYANFQTKDSTLKSFIHKFDRPHRKIHAVADRVKELIQSGQHEEARQAIDSARANELKAMVQLFRKAGDIIAETHREIAMVIETPAFDYGVAIDQVLAVEFLKQGTIEDLPRGLDMQVTNNIVTLIGRRQGNNSTVQILDPLRICDPDDVKGLVLDPQLAKELEPAEELMTV